MNDPRSPSIGDSPCRRRRPRGPRALRDMGRAVLLAALPWGCASLDERDARPLVPPLVGTTTRHFAGSPLAGPLPGGETAPGAFDDAPAVTVTVFALASMPVLPEAFEPVASAARMIGTQRGEEPIVPVPMLLRAATAIRDGAGTPAATLDDRLLRGELGRAAPIAMVRGILPRGVTFSMTSIDSAEVSSPDDSEPPWRPRVELLVHRDAADPAAAALPDRQERFEFAVVIEGLAVVTLDEEPAEGASDEPPAAPEPPATRSLHVREFAIVERRSPPLSQLSFALILPSPFGGGRARALAAIIDLRPFSPDADPAARDDRERLAVRAAAEIAGQQDRGGAGSADVEPPSDLASALDALSLPSARRNGLIVLADATGALAAGAIALSADDDLCQELAVAVLNATGSAAAEPAPPEIGWALERAALGMLADHMAEGTMTSALEAILLDRAGEVGRNAKTLIDIVGAAQGLDDLGARLVAENLIFLEDSSPAARVRAQRYLAARGRAPAGFDPLAAPKERRAALERAAAPSTPAGPAGGSS